MAESERVLQAVPDNGQVTSLVYSLDELLKLRDVQPSKICPASFDKCFINSEGRFDPEAWVDSQRKHQSRSRAASEPRNRNARPTTSSSKENRRISNGTDRSGRPPLKSNKKADGGPLKQSHQLNTTPKQGVKPGSTAVVENDAAKSSKDSSGRPMTEKRVRIAEPNKSKPVVNNDEELERLSCALRQVILGNKPSTGMSPKMHSLAEVEATLLNKSVPTQHAPSDKAGFYRLIESLKKKVSDASTPVSELPPHSNPEPLLNPSENAFLRHQQWVGPLLTCQFARAVPHGHKKSPAASSSYPRNDAEKIDIQSQINYLPSVSSATGTEKATATNTPQVIPTSMEAIPSTPLLPSPVFHNPSLGPHASGLLLNHSSLSLYYQLAQMAANAHMYGTIRNSILAGNCKNPMGAHLISTGYLPAVSTALLSKYIANHSNLGPYSFRPNQMNLYASQTSPTANAKAVAE